MNKEAPPTPWPWLRIIGAAGLGLGGLYLLYTVLHASSAGFEFTDEGFYLLWLKDPWVYTASATQFGFVYHGLYRLLDGDIALLRQVNFLLTYVLSAIFGSFVIRDLLPAGNAGPGPHGHHRRGLNTLFALGLAGTAFAFPASWIATPSYNSLIMQAALLIGISFYLIRSRGLLSRISGGLMMGLGGVLAFQAKPTAAAAFALVALLFLLTERRRALVPLLIAGASALVGLLLFAHAIDGSLSAHIQRLREGASIMGLLAANHTLGDLLRLDPIHMTSAETAAALSLMLASLLWLLSLRLLLPLRRRLGIFIGMGMAVSGILALILFQVGRAPEFAAGVDFSYFRLIPTLGFAVAALIALAMAMLPALAMAILSAPGTPRDASLPPFPNLRPSLVTGFLFLLFPLAASFGTNNNMWGSSSQHALFWIAGGLLLMRPLLPPRREPEALIPIVALAIIYVGITVHLSLAAPYRQTASLDAAHREVSFGNARLRLSDDFADSIEQSRALARQAGFPEGGWILDFSGRSPGLVYVLGGKTPGLAWWTGGYPGTTAMVTYALKDVSCEDLLSAWILAEPGTPLALDPAILTSFGASENDYEAVARFMPPTGWGVPQYLLRPKPELAAKLTACRALQRN